MGSGGLGVGGTRSSSGLHVCNYYSVCKPSSAAVTSPLSLVNKVMKYLFLGRIVKNCLIRGPPDTRLIGSDFH